MIRNVSNIIVGDLLLDKVRYLLNPEIDRVAAIDISVIGQFWPDSIDWLSSFNIAKIFLSTRLWRYLIDFGVYYLGAIYIVRSRIYMMERGNSQNVWRKRYNWSSTAKKPFKKFHIFFLKLVWPLYLIVTRRLARATIFSILIYLTTSCDGVQGLPWL